MPSLFDSHDEFNEWFSKDIESHAENKSQMDDSRTCSIFLGVSRQAGNFEIFQNI
jgi:SNF2 family DNA or RNA helicase